MTTIACCAPTLVPAIPALPASLPMPRILPAADAAALRLHVTPATPVRLGRPAWARAWDAVAERWLVWRAEARHRADLRALARLDRHVLRDVGLGDLVPPPVSPSWQDLERARW